ncbi:TerD family protein [Pradoshia sp. D12]|uniref:TerD family protein n=1 Tax=Bacillaceae TaxID=186817 RepID=UPI00080AF112|nr:MULTISPECIES: TerD family protein [Bacillaceae]OCA86784.1 stress protein [Bacillus sp. FJAT-27986]QFK71447.1 TerD family protein [Pradoshia sp. D12]TPF73242.1 TerD family protein [Bacillus sp. D12]
MAISLQKGQRIDLTKGNANLNTIMVGLGWDPVKKKGGFFSRSADVDCDASVIMLTADKLQSNKDLVYFGNKKSACSSVIHSGDNLTGDGDGDDESIKINLKSVPNTYNKLVFVVNIYNCVQRKQDFGMIENAYIRVVNHDTGEELVRFNLSDNYAGLTTLITGEIYRHNSEWKFAAIGDGTKDSSLSEICSKYQ